MRTAIAHCNKNVVFLKADNGFENLLSVNIHFRFGIIENFTVADKDNVRIIKLNEFGGAVFNQMDYCEG